MENTNRRTFLAISGAGVAAIGVAAVPTGLAGAAVTTSERTHEPPVDLKEMGDELLLAAVTDLGRGEVTVVHGGVETVLTDHDLARKIARLSRTEA
jgi:hypothetical protein